MANLRIIDNKVYFKANMILENGTEITFECNDMRNKENIRKLYNWLMLGEISYN